MRPRRSQTTGDVIAFKSIRTTQWRGQIWRQAEDLQSSFLEIDRLVDSNSRRVRKACRDERVGPQHFAGSSGYGHGDLGRAALDRVLPDLYSPRLRHSLFQVVAQSFGAESALVRHHFVSGTHAIAAALFGVLRPGDELICVTGR